MTRTGISYAPKTEDHMDEVLNRRDCPTCGAKLGEPCIMASGKPVKRVTEVHTARFGKRPRRVA